MNKNLLIITSEYFPIPSPNGACVSELVKKLKTEYNIIIISNNGEDKFEEKIKVVNTHFNKEVEIKQKRNLSRIVKIMRRLINFNIYPITNKDLLIEYKKKAQEIISNNKIDKVIVTFNPPEAVYTGLFLSRRYHIPLIMLNYDSMQLMSNKHKNNPFINYVNSNRERRIIKRTDKFIIMKSHISLYRNLLRKYKNKIFITDYPNYNPIKNTKVTKNTVSNLVYTGALYQNLREPYYACEILKDINISKINFYTNNVFNDYFVDMSQKTKGKIQYCELVPEDKLDIILSQADFLLNISNTDSHQIPSKIFKYMSFGVPIINIVTNRIDPILSYFENYPLVLNIIKDDFDIIKTKEIVNSFIEENIDKRVSYSVLKEILKLNQPEHTISLLR